MSPEEERVIIREALDRLTGLLETFEALVRDQIDATKGDSQN